MRSFPAAYFAIGVLALGTCAHLVIAAWAMRVWPRFARYRRTIAVVSVVLSALPSVTRQVTLRTRDPVADVFHAASMVELTFVVVVAPALLGLVMVGWWRGARAWAKADAHAEADAGADAEADADAEAEAEAHAETGAEAHAKVLAFVGRRDALTTIGGAAVLGTTGLAFGWGAMRGRFDYQLREVVVRIAGLPKALDGYVIAQVSDLHAGLFVREKDIDEGFALVRAMRPDLVVATGDLVDFDARDAAPLARALADLAPRDGVYGILGNHDYYAGAAVVTDAMRRAGITMLINESRVIRPGDGGGFALLGVDDEWAGKYGARGRDLDRAEAGVAPDMARILLAHQPRTFHVASGRVALQLSGHTHGGQIRPADWLMRWSAGRYEQKGSTLYVNRGFGVAGPPARIGVPPEVTKVVLVAG